MPLTDEQWQILQPIFPLPVDYDRGRPPVDDRLVLNAVLYKFACDIPWYDLPSHYPSHQTCYRRYRQWRRTGQLRQALAALHHDLCTRGGLDPHQALSNGDLAFQNQSGQLIFTCAPHLRDTWQFFTSCILLALAFQVARGKKL